MNGLVTVAVRLIRAGQKISLKKRNYFVLFVFVFIMSAVTLARFDLLPQKAAADANTSAGFVNQTADVGFTKPNSELPLKIEIQKINLSATIANPMTTDVATLDRDLLSGAVRYPTSAKLGEDGNVVLFGHSSYLPIVGNQAYKTFNGIQKLKEGDAVIVSSSDTAYTYVVRRVTKESANDAVIPLAVDGQVLTLSTCDSFAAKTDRFIVVADFVGSHPK